MKKQLNPTIKAHLIRSAFYVLLLLAVCVIPFALAQRNATGRSAAKPKIAGAPAAHPKSRAVQSQIPYDLRPLPAQAPKFPYSSIRDRRAPVDEKATSAANRTSRVHRITNRPTGVCNYTFTTGSGSIVPG